MAVWIGAASNEWNNPVNWREGVVPAGPVDLVFDRATPYNRQEIAVPTEGVTIKNVAQKTGIFCGFSGGPVTFTDGAVLAIDGGRLNLLSHAIFEGSLSITSTAAGSVWVKGPTTDLSGNAVISASHAVLYFVASASLPGVVLEIREHGGVVVHHATVTVAAVVGQVDRVQLMYTDSVLTQTGA